MTSPNSLSSIQAKFQRSVFHDACPEASDFAADIKGAGTLSGDEALEVYRKMHRIRMEDSMAMDFPATQRFLGPRRFARLIEDYWREYPSWSYSLDHLGRYFPVFLAKQFGQGEFISELALFESILHQVALADEPSAHPITTEAMETPEALLNLTFVRPPTTVIESFNYDFATYFDALWRGNRKTPLAPFPLTIIFSRVHFQTRYRSADPDELQLLLKLFAGKTMAESFTIVPENPTQYLDKVSHWFRTWTSAHIIFTSEVV